MRLTGKVSKDWFIDYLIANGEIVEYWNIYKLLFNSGNESELTKSNISMDIENYSELENLINIENNKKAIYVMLIDYSIKSKKLYTILTNYNKIMIFIRWGAMPAIKNNILIKLNNNILNPLLIFKKIKQKIINKLEINDKVIKPFAIEFVAGKELLPYVKTKGKVIPINLCDYENYIECINYKTYENENKYVVFLDINLPYQSDHNVMESSPINPNTYYDSLNRFFKIIEFKFKVEVIIAAHPQSINYENRYFGRKVLHSKTAELVKNAEFIINHHSTSQSYAILFGKPTIFIYTNEMKKLYRHGVFESIKALSKFLNSNIYNIDKIKLENQIDIKPINTNRYFNYKYNYITSKETEQISSKEIFMNEIKKLNIND